MTLLFLYGSTSLIIFYEYTFLTITYQLEHQIMPVNLFRNSCRNWESPGE